MCSTRRRSYGCKCHTVTFSSLLLPDMFFTHHPLRYLSYVTLSVQTISPPPQIEPTPQKIFEFSHWGPCSPWLLPWYTIAQYKIHLRYSTLPTIWTRTHSTVIRTPVTGDTEWKCLEMSFEWNGRTWEFQFSRQLIPCTRFINGKFLFTDLLSCL